jgi:hypothetical protein
MRTSSTIVTMSRNATIATRNASAGRGSCMVRERGGVRASAP